MTREDQPPGGPRLIDSGQPASRRTLWISIAVLALLAVAATSALVTVLVTNRSPSVASAPVAPTSRSVSPTTPEVTTPANTAPAPSASSAPSTAAVTSSPTTPSQTSPSQTTPSPPPPSKAPKTTVIVTQWGKPVGPPAAVTSLDKCQTSNKLTRPDALRCFTSPLADGSNVFDPCFGADNADGLACPSAPWSNEYVKIAGIGQSGDTSGPKTGGLPWGLELSDGNRCAAASGGTNSIGGKRLNYFCSGGGAVYGTQSVAIRGKSPTLKKNSPVHSCRSRSNAFGSKRLSHSKLIHNFE